MLWATLWYTRNGAVTATYCPFWYSCVGSMSAPAGPVPLIPNRLWSLIASALWPQPDSSIAWAIVTAAGMPYRLCMAMAPGASWLMNACWEAVPGTCVGSAVGALLVYDGADGVDEPRGGPPPRLRPQGRGLLAPPRGCVALFPAVWLDLRAGLLHVGLRPGPPPLACCSPIPVGLFPALPPITVGRAAPASLPRRPAGDR